MDVCDIHQAHMWDYTTCSSIRRYAGPVYLWSGYPGIWTKELTSANPFRYHSESPCQIWIESDEIWSWRSHATYRQTDWLSPLQSRLAALPGVAWVKHKSPIISCEMVEKCLQTSITNTALCNGQPIICPTSANIHKLTNFEKMCMQNLYWIL
jgi:hypothetical protein